ncbi:branched-chain amino acid ABC transporter substrate-binding protein [Synergistales bacterium]|nr:branched-chain amino acid ABC transporter substrate-binding protein [Synergistales bacterium]
MKKNAFAIFLVLVVLMVLFSGCASAATPKASDETIKIGCVYPLTGDNSAIGLNIMKGIEFTVNEINAQGGVLGKKLEIVPGDTQGDQKVAMSIAERLITMDGVSILIGCQASGISEVVSQVAEKYKTPMMSPISTADQLTTHGYKYYFRFAPTNSIYLRSMIEYLIAVDANPDIDVSIKNIAIVSDNTLLGQETAKWAKYWAKEYNLPVVAEVVYTQGAADLTSEVLTLKSANADALVADCYISDGILFNKTMVEQGYAPNVMVGKGTAFVDPSYIPATGPISNGISTALEWNFDLTKGKDINERFKKIYGINMNGHAAEAFCAVWTIKTALEAAGSPERDALRDALEKVEIKGSFPNGPEIMLPYDTISFGNPEWQNIKHTHTNEHAIVAVGQIQDGVLRSVWPFEYASYKVITPAPYK